jgi:hypothetical protein
MDENRMPKKILHGRIEGKRKRGRPRKRWLRDLQEDLRVMHVGRRWEKVENREELGRIVKEAKAHSGLECQGRRRRRKSPWHPLT